MSWHVAAEQDHYPCKLLGDFIPGLNDGVVTTLVFGLNSRCRGTASAGTKMAWYRHVARAWRDEPDSEPRIFKTARLARGAPRTPSSSRNLRAGILCFWVVSF